MKAIATIIASAIMMATVASAETPTVEPEGLVDGLVVSDPVVRLKTRAEAHTFMAIENNSDKSCSLESVETDAAQSVEFHTVERKRGDLTMVEKEEPIEIAPGEEEIFNHFGNHVMLIDVDEDADVVPITLNFGDCGTELIEVPVEVR